MLIYTLHNVTRYNTNDLEALFTYIEEYIRKQGRGVKPGTFPAYGQDVTYGLDLHVQYAAEKDITRGQRAGLAILKIPRPENLYDTPLEALAATGTREKPKIPKDKLEELAREILMFYAGTGLVRLRSHPMRSGDNILWGAAPAVHIENKPQGTQTKLDKKKLSERKKVTKAIGHASWMVHQSSKRDLAVLKNVMRALEEAAPHMEPAEAEVLEAFRELSSSYEKARKLTQPGEPK